MEQGRERKRENVRRKEKRPSKENVDWATENSVGQSPPMVMPTSASGVATKSGQAARSGEESVISWGR